MTTTSAAGAQPDPSETLDPEATLIAEGAPSEDLLRGGQLRIAMVALMFTLFLAALDQTVVATALPRITSELGGLNQLAWVVTAYLLAATASTPIWGKISDLYGRKPMLQIAIVVFLVGSVAAGAAQSMMWLILTRGIQGLGGGGLMVLVMAVIADVIPPRERGRYVGLFGGVFAIASIAGPLLGGFSSRASRGAGSSTSISPLESRRSSSSRQSSRSQFDGSTTRSTIYAPYSWSRASAPFSSSPNGEDQGSRGAR